MNPTPTLRELQESMQAIITLSEKNGLASKASEFLEEGGKWDRNERVAIYQDAYFIRILQSLKSDFPILCRCLGEENFENLVKSLLRSQPSRFPNLSELGGELVKEVNRQKEQLPYPFLADVADMEWGAEVCFWRENHPMMTMETLTGLENIDQIFWEIHPSVIIKTFEYPVDRLWHWEGKPLLSDLPELSIPSPVTLMFSRDVNFNVNMKKLENEEKQLFELFVQGTTLADLETQGKTNPERIGSYLADWISRGCLKNVGNT